MWELCRRHGIAETTFHRWRAKYGGRQVARPALMQLEDENRRLKRVLAEQALDHVMLNTWRRELVTTTHRRRVVSHLVAAYPVSARLASR
ncbi:MAG: transposase [Gemmatimonadetes bacterium]|nr:transposase [Gemmatimonadota bacterium]